VGTLETETCADKLAQFFPEAAAVRIPVQVTTLRIGAANLKENTLVEFVASDHAIFACSLPLEFDDRVRLTPTAQGRGRKAADGKVIAVQYHEGHKAVAVRFLGGRLDWVRET
jgi:hypothetical protein